jgi:twitching motility protein PilT
MKLNDVPISDMYICLNPELGGNHAITWVKPAQKNQGRVLAPLTSQFDSEINHIRMKLASEKKREFSIVHDGLRYRCAKLDDANASWVVLRRGVTTLPHLTKLGLPQNVVSTLMSVGLRYGLTLIAGSPGSGKTTMASALLRAYLEKFGYVAVTVEDPPEHPLSGFYEQGICYQTSVENEDWENSIKAVFRYGAKYLFVGEIRTPGAAIECLRAAMRGHVVIATLHASDLAEAIEVMLALASQRAGDSAKTLLAHSISSLFYLELDTKLHVNSLFAGEGMGDPVRSLIRLGMFEQLGTVISQQRAQIENGTFTVKV